MFNLILFFVLLVIIEDKVENFYYILYEKLEETGSITSPCR